MINFNIDLGEWVANMIDKLENSPKVRKMIWAVIGICAIYALSALISSFATLKWW